MNWSSVAGAGNYRLEEQTNGGGWFEIQSGSSLSRGITGKVDGTYGYRVRACMDSSAMADCSEYSAIRTTAVTLLTAPTLDAPATNSDGRYTVSWTSVAGADNYRLEEQVDGGNWNSIQSSSSLSRTISDQANGTFSYRVRACVDSSATSDCSSYSLPVSTVVRLVIVKMTQQNKVVTSSVDAPASACATFRLTAAGEITFQAACGGAFDEQAPYDEWLAAGSASDAAGFEVYAWLVGGDTPTTGILNSWQRLDVARDFGLQRSEAGTSESLLAISIRRVGTTTSLAFADVTLRAMVVGDTLPPTGGPFMSASTPTIDGRFRVSWTGVSKATRYELEEKPVWNLYWTQIQNDSAMSADLQRGGGDYWYRARACNDAGCGPYSGELLVQVQGDWVIDSLAAPILTLSSIEVAREESVALNWNPVDGATEYRLEELRAGARPQAAYRGTERASGQRKSEPGRYGYRVQACNASGCGPHSEVKLLRVRGGQPAGQGEGE